MSEVKVDKISPRAGTDVTLGDSGDTFTIPSGATLTNSGTATGFGKVLQVVSATKTDTASSTSTSFVTSGLEVSITPSSTSNKILVMAQAGLGGDGNYINIGAALQRDSTILNQADTAGSRSRYSSASAYVYMSYDIRAMPMIYLDSPSSTSSLTYKVMYKSTNASYSVYLNRANNDTDTVHYGRGASTITVMEIAG